MFRSGSKEQDNLSAINTQKTKIFFWHVDLLSRKLEVKIVEPWIRSTSLKKRSKKLLHLNFTEGALTNHKKKFEKMICHWSDCGGDFENLGHHLFVEHLESIPRSYTEFYCLWRNCDCETIFKYKSHLVLHLRDHLSGKIKMDDTSKQVVHQQETMQIIPAVPGDQDDAHYEIIANYGSRIRCPIQNCKQGSFLLFFITIMNSFRNILLRVWSSTSTFSIRGNCEFWSNVHFAAETLLLRIWVVIWTLYINHAFILRAVKISCTWKHQIQIPVFRNTVIEICNISLYSLSISLFFNNFMVVYWRLGCSLLKKFTVNKNSE